MRFFPPVAALFLLLCVQLSGGIVLSQIRFETNFSSDEAQLLRQSGLIQGSEVEMTDLLTAGDRLAEYLRSQGRIYVTIDNPIVTPLEANCVSVLYDIRERVSSDQVTVRFTGMRYFSEDKLRQFLVSPASKLYSLADLPQLLTRITDLYTERGYLFVSTELQELGLDTLSTDARLTALIRITENKPMRLQEIVCSGNAHTRSDALIRASGLFSTRMITPALLSSAEQKILSKPYIRSCVVEPLNDSTILIRVEEGKMTYLEGVAGFSRVEGKTRLNGLVTLKFLNLWGSDRAVNLFWKQIPGGSGTLDLSYHESGFARYPFAADLSLNRVTQDSTWIKSKTGLDIYYYRLAHKLGVELISEGISPGYGRPTTIESSSSRSLGAFWTYKQTDHPKNPARGMESELRYRLIFGGAEAKNALELDGWGYIPLSGRWTTALGLHIRTLDAEPTQDHELYKIGGYGSLRGYRDDAISGWRLGWANAELRYRLSPDSRAYFFYDQGANANRENSLNWSNLSLGLGIKLQTKLGILSLEYALGYNGNTLNNINMGIIHAGIDTSF
ncbi:MAG TPA: BamA/TamA family outer membrane protein [Candidatus Cloacimonadota bacterium]|nr:BamA/TamA family outer membrane protein [Candidatus Cloacimonadota bacterium]